MTQRDEVLQQVLALSSQDQIFVLGKLEESLAQAEDVTHEIDPELAAEIVRRIEASDRGEMKSYDLETTMADAHKMLEERRAGRPQ